MKVIFESINIYFVLVSKELINDYLDMMNDNENVNRFFGVSNKTFTYKDEIKWVEDELKANALVWSMIEKESNKFIGNIELMEMDDNGKELGIAITANMQNKGYGTEAINTLLQYAKEKLQLKKIFLRTRLYNERAIHVYKKCGFNVYKEDQERYYMEIEL